MSLSEADLSAVLQDIHPARTKWYNIGLQLGVLATDLDAIRAQYANPEDDLCEMLKKWLKVADPVPTWEAVVNALKNVTVEEFQLAERLQQKHKHATATVSVLQGIGP